MKKSKYFYNCCSYLQKYCILYIFIYLYCLKETLYNLETFNNLKICCLFYSSLILYKVGCFDTNFFIFCVLTLDNYFKRTGP